MAFSAAHRLRRRIRRTTALLASLLLLAGCVYRLDVQQGNLLDQEDIAAIQPGMTRSQVRYLLGTPISADAFQPERWDYMYYLRPGRSRKATQRWVVVWFTDDKVTAVSPDVTPGSNPARPGPTGPKASPPNPS